MSALYGTKVTAKLATRALILAQLVALVTVVGLHVTYEEALLPGNLLEIREELYGRQGASRLAYIAGALVVFQLASLAGLFFMAVWARWLFTATSIVGLLYSFLDWSSVTIEADVLQASVAVIDVLDGALLAVIWLNAWTDADISTASGTTGVDST